MQKSELRSFAGARLRAVSGYLSRAYVAGPELHDALAAFDRFAQQGYGGTIGYFNPGQHPPREIADVNLALLAALTEKRRDGYVSIKVPPMQFDAALVGEIAQQSSLTGVGIHFDSHAIETTEPTFNAIAAALRHTPRVGCTLPGRWARSLDDAERALDWKLRVRVVKGQWADPSQPDGDLRKGYLRVIDRLAGSDCAVGVATNDPVLARHALVRLCDAGTRCELELLFGLPLRVATAVARDMGVPVRVYVPFGTAWLPYALTTLLRKPETLWWLCKDLMAAVAPRLAR